MRKVVPLGVLLCFAALVLATVEPATCAAQTATWNDTTARQEMKSFQQFLSDHPWIARKLREEPSRANSKDFLNGNPELPRFLNAHPYIERGLRADAKGFMQQEREFELSPSAEQGPWNSLGSSENNQEMLDFRQFLSDHSWIARQLQQDPALANNQDFLNANPELGRFLSAHPDVRQGLQANATGFLRRAQQSAPSYPEASRGSWNSGESRAESREMQDFQQFLNNHPWIAKKLRENPSQANNRDFLNGNPALPQFLNAHPFVQSQFKADPSGFMQRALNPAGWTSGRDLHAADYASLNHFMMNHPWIGNNLKQDPKLANSHDFLNDNKELRDFLGAHPYLQQQFQQDPRGVIDRARQLAGQE